jgi:CBS domain-containing protein/gamma-glutamyl:cysteine ligase YbdK (ATP-grasp superfamily)
MGDKDAEEFADQEQQRAFTRALLDDVEALSRMIDGGMIETGIRRIGAEQEIFLVDEGCMPAPVSTEVLERLDHPLFTTELARFNLEANLPPHRFGEDCLSRLEEEIRSLLALARQAAQESHAELLLTGILPTLALSDLSLENMAPVPRYAALNAAMVKARGGDFQVQIKGIDEFFTTHDNVMLESCNTSFQIHFQVGPEEFAQLYNLAQAVTAPVLAAAVNSPFLAEHRLWHETRVALFQHSIDHRSSAQLLRGQRPRVQFGEKWIDDSVLEIFRDDIARFRVMLSADVDEKPLEMVARGEAPRLHALSHHNGTVYRWNRPCYGVNEGVAHLRIENRVLPAGPTVLDEIANAAFYYGLLAALSKEHDDITKVMDFDDAKANFVAAARHGLRAQFAWIGGESATAAELIQELLPMAREGLRSHGIYDADVDRYLGVIEERVKSGRTGAQWALDSLAKMGNEGTRSERFRAVACASLERQRKGEPVHAWPLAQLDEAMDWRHSYKTVGQFMTRDLFTVQPDDLVDLAANLMDWERIRHVPVEDEEGRLVGLVSFRSLIRLLAQGGRDSERGQVVVRNIMKESPVTVGPDTPTLEAVEKMRAHQVACLPVVKGDKLVGILTERDLINVAAKLLDRELRDFG